VDEAGLLPSSDRDDHDADRVITLEIEEDDDAVVLVLLAIRWCCTLPLTKLG
jgi:hypothetical protein